MTPLPDWVEQHQMWALSYANAFAIAWEALEKCAECCDNHSGIPKEAMRRIRELTLVYDLHR